MKPSLPLSFVVVALAALAAVPIYRLSAAGPENLPIPSPQKWEYAELRYDDRTGDHPYTFTTADSHAEADDANAMLTKLGEKPADDADLVKADMALFNQIGSRGWELVTVSPVAPWGTCTDANTAVSTGYGRSYLFKRLAPK